MIATPIYFDFLKPDVMYFYFCFDRVNNPFCFNISKFLLSVKKWDALYVEMMASGSDSTLRINISSFLQFTRIVNDIQKESCEKKTVFIALF